MSSHKPASLFNGRRAQGNAVALHSVMMGVVAHFPAPTGEMTGRGDWGMMPLTVVASMISEPLSTVAAEQEVLEVPGQSTTYLTSAVTQSGLPHDAVEPTQLSLLKLLLTVLYRCKHF